MGVNWAELKAVGGERQTADKGCFPNEPVDDLVAKLRRYSDWFGLLAPKADADREKAARRQGVAVHGFRLWSRIYPATGREGYVPVAFVFTGRTKAQRASRMRRLEQAARSYFAGTKYPGGDITAVDYHQGVPVVVTELERITADPAGAAGPVWRRLGREEWQTLSEALDNPDGERSYRVQEEQSRRRQMEREAAEREAQRPVCTRCGTKFADERWLWVRHHPRLPHRDLCDPCLDEHHEQVRAEKAARIQAEEAVAREAAAAEAKKNRSLFRRR
ncbi:hypothetical protein [Streptomyces sp. NPDC048462]|uniref:hypothetical protein n=1 Tax=Streptomyces sp. NPDC048462 TaxID=3365555 RepID=UPI00371128B0